MKRLLIGAGIACSVFSQEIQQKTQGRCSPAVVSKGNVTITCAGVDPKLADEFLRLSSLLDKVVKQQIDPALLFSKLEEVVRVQKETIQHLKEQGHRRLSSADSERLSRELRTFSPNSITVFVYHAIMSAESLGYARDFISALKAAGWTVEHKGGTDLGFGQTNVLVVLPEADDKEEVRIASVLVQSLTDIGIPVKAGRHRLVKQGVGLVIPTK